ncbi:hypothetical protein SCARR_01038 [Pontiella sulfatireligans]|uniref:DUF3732 domain-containing protein n=2 Tax=Pontiella sulfatireligans TaxID=2750658 RepID=A0A6C2UI30_9BACT|nr:hypothetical protein SCARR_01038 [Pontiella sulfatireligans]
MFNTLSQDIIINSAVFFDKQNSGRYREALERIFDLAIGVDTIENIISREKKAELEKELKRQERRGARYAEKRIEFEREVDELIKRAKEYELIPDGLDVDASLDELRHVIKEFSGSLLQRPSTDVDTLKQSENQARLTIRNLERLNQGYRKYKDALTKSVDSLRPLAYIQNKKSEIVQTSIFSELVNALETDLLDIKEDVKKRTAIEKNLNDLIAEENSKIGRIQKDLAISAQELRAFNTDREKHFFMGKLAAQLDLYTASASNPDVDIKATIDSVTEDLKQITVRDVAEQRGMTVRLLEEIMQEYINLAGDALENYKSYHPQFDYKEKVLSLRKPFTDYVDSVGSSSNHLFLHLFLFLGLHELVKSKDVPFIPPFLIIDQPSRPYWGDTGEGKGEGVLKTGDDEKIRKAFELLDSFMDKMLKNGGPGFQMIVLEHVPANYWKGLDNIHPVEEFIGGNALIRPEDISELTDQDSEGEES